MPNKRILVIEDDATILRTLRIALTRAGYQVIEASQGEEATRLWREQPADLVITDLHMPEMSRGRPATMRRDLAVT